MPLSTDERVNVLADELVKMFDLLFGRHSGFRAAHAKGQLLQGTFTPTPQARDVSKSVIFAQSFPILVRFSDSTGVPVIPDNDPNSNPKGIAIRFQLGDRKHTDIVGHSTDGFPARTGEEFLEFLRALSTSDMKAPSDPANPKPIEKFLGSHPAALAFVQTPKPFPSSFARENFFGVSSLKFTNSNGKVRFGRYRVVPVAGVDHLDQATAAAKGPNFLFEELTQRIASGPISFRLQVQLANEGDEVNDATVHWPADRAVVELGTISLTSPVSNDAAEQQRAIFDPIPRIEGIDPSDDPLLDLRAAVYLISGRRRRADPATTAQASH